MNSNIKNILKNNNILKNRYTECINDSLGRFKSVEKAFVEKLLNEINNYLQNVADSNDPIDFHKDVKGHYYEVYDICNYNNWDEWKEYLKYIKDPWYDGNLNIHKFMVKSLTKYGLPRENIFSCYDNGWFRYKLMDFENKDGNLGIGEKYEDYE